MDPTLILAGMFRQEAEELLDRIEAATLALETRPGEGVDELFRVFHTLKGSAGVAGIPSIASFTHHVETALAGVRNAKVGPAPALVTAILESKDHVAALLVEATGGPACDRTVATRLIDIFAGVTSVSVAPASPDDHAVTDYFVTFKPRAALEVAADDVLAELRTLGTCEVIAAPGASVEPDGTPSAWQIMVTTTRGELAIREAFIVIEREGQLEIDRGLSEFVDEPAPPARPPPPPAPSAIVTPTLSPPAESVLRVPTTRLDQLMKLVGELVITQSRLEQAATGTPELAGPVEAMERLITDLRDSVLGLRMIPIGATFSRFQRLIRDLSHELGKDVELITTGDDTELDKSIIDQLGDALVHLLRNSMDHGLESPSERLAAGKPERGRLRLAASQEGIHVVVAISDDGRGIDPAAIRRAAEARGLVASTDTLSEQDTLALITRPGFSTAPSVTELSGRGVGMDVVKKTVERLRGSLTISSRVGSGTTIRLTLPLTLAIIDGLLVEVAGDRFIVPMAAVTENLELTCDERRAHNGRNAVALRGELVPTIRLRDLFAMGDDDDGGVEKVVVVAIEAQRVGLVVDRVIGSHQTVIQPLGRLCRGLDLFSGTTILGDGRVAMILDLAGTLRRVAHPSATVGGPARN